ncbi:alpha/beta hydrolase [Amycolatopsis rhizosphaerae]|uniref:Alpha/beta hydrolase n=1 Tax=Amycolatopsis rhizosphaerae TaxID=2053003 RepID=A0A558BFA5_9PSEU|nr:alpha/beta hydrolase [Amycolatopsis rhizosphaerae]
MPRFRYDPNAVIEDYANAVGHLFTRDGIDHDRIGLVGVCMGGGYAVSLGARDKRLKAVVSIAGGYDIGGTFQQFLGVDGFATYYRSIAELVQRQYESGEIAYVPTIAKALSAEVPVAVMPNEEAYSYYDRTFRTDAPNWSGKMTADSLLPYFTYNAVAHAPLVAPTPLMIVHGATDTALLPEYAQQAYEAAQGRKELVWIETHNHIELYDQAPYVTEAAAHAIRWLDEHLEKGR